ncbi:hypothetical protein, partial [Falsirhodobacter xinxiangensis]|uniref:hypothetical protein n=1 Tax=Falsirhodobacter xinxiangensis TaxID=2530049 RepID=UPI001C70AE46
PWPTFAPPLTGSQAKGAINSLSTFYNYRICHTAHGDSRLPWSKAANREKPKTCSLETTPQLCDRNTAHVCFPFHAVPT